MFVVTSSKGVVANLLAFTYSYSNNIMISSSISLNTFLTKLMDCESGYELLLPHKLLNIMMMVLHTIAGNSSVTNVL